MSVSQLHVWQINVDTWGATADGRTIDGFATEALAQKWVDDVARYRAREQAIEDALRLVRRVAAVGDGDWPLWDGDRDTLVEFVAEARRLVAQLDGGSDYPDRVPDAESAALGRPKGE